MYTCMHVCEVRTYGCNVMLVEQVAECGRGTLFSFPAGPLGEHPGIHEGLREPPRGFGGFLGVLGGTTATDNTAPRCLANSHGGW